MEVPVKSNAVKWECFSW